MTENRLYVHMLLDRSGSMESCRDTTISAFNNYVRSLKVHDATLTRLSLTQFDTQSIDLVHDAQSVHIVPDLTRETFVPRGGTPLYDAIGQTVAHMDRVKLVGDETVSLVILTDGGENSSKEHTKGSIKALLDTHQNERGWLVLYLGANQDAFAESRKIGIEPSYALRYSPGLEDRALRSAVRSTTVYVETKRRSAAAFTREERSEAIGGPVAAPKAPGTRKT